MVEDELVIKGLTVLAEDSDKYEEIGSKEQSEIDGDHQLQIKSRIMKN